MDTTVALGLLAGVIGAITAEWRIADASWTQFFGRFRAVEQYYVRSIVTAPP